MKWHNKVNSGQLLLPRGHFPNRYFDGTDTEELYKLNLQRQPTDWRYRTQAVEYEWNSNGYRTVEWSDVTWSDSHIIMGCSFVAGFGVALEDTVSSRLELLLNEPVINLGFGGGGPTVVHYNTLMLIQAGVKPRSVSIVAPGINRYTMFDKWNARHIVPGNMFEISEADYKDFYALYISNTINSTAHGRLALDTAQTLWTSIGVPVNMFDFNSDINEYTHLPITDFGRDLVPAEQTVWQKIRKEPIMWTGHAGHKTYEHWAHIMFDKIRR